MEGLTGRVATSADFEKLQPLLQADCQNQQYKFAGYELAVKMLLDGPDFGVVLMAEQEGNVVGFCAFSYEYSDMRDGAWFWMQGLHVVENFCSAAGASADNAEATRDCSYQLEKLRCIT